MAKIFVASGHGGTDPGAVYKNRKEKDYNLKIANELAKLLKANGHEVLQCKTTDKTVTIDEKMKMANEFNSDFFIEIHLNATIGGTGTEVFHSYKSELGKNIATEISEKISKTFNLKNRGAKIKTYIDGTTKDYFGVIRKSNCTSVLVECCFIDNDSDMKKFDELKTAQVISEVLDKFYTPKAYYNYTVKSGESFYSIARDTMGNGGKYKELANFNNLKITDTIHTGQVLKIPLEKIYVQVTKFFEIEKENTNTIKLRGITEEISKGDIKYV